jgi:hypothetical protein
MAKAPVTNFSKLYDSTGVPEISVVLRQKSFASSRLRACQYDDLCNQSTDQNSMREKID